MVDPFFTAFTGIRSDSGMTGARLAVVVRNASLAVLFGRSSLMIGGGVL